MADPAQEPPGRAHRGRRSRVESNAVYRYNEHNDGFDMYGALVTWDGTDLSKNQVKSKFDGVLALLRQHAKQADHPPIPKPGQPGKTLKRKLFPYFRRIAKNKGIVAFKTWSEANEFADKPHMQFKALIPLSFIVTLGDALFSAPPSKINTSEILPCGGNFEIVHARKKEKDKCSTLVTIAFRGTTLPASVICGKYTAEVRRHARGHVHCSKCLRYGHRKSNCFRKGRCGCCAPVKPLLRHTENKCHMIRVDQNFIRCIDCTTGHPTASGECAERTEQDLYKAHLNKYRIDFKTTMESFMIPMIRSTTINSTRDFVVADRRE